MTGAKGYWDINPILSYNALFNYVVGGRNLGKTFGCKEYAIKKYLEKGEQFVYLRRYRESDLQFIRFFFDDIKEYFPDHDLECDGTYFYIDGNQAGFAHALSTPNALKGVVVPNVGRIIFDEFIIEQGPATYIKNEARTFLEFYISVSRFRDVPVFFLSNAISVVNPYFNYFDILPPPKPGIKRISKEIVIERADADGYRERVRNTRVGSIISDTPYYEYAVNNKFLLDDYNFIEPKSPKARPYYGVAYKGEELSVWLDKERPMFYLTKGMPNGLKPVFALTTQDHKPNALYAGRSMPHDLKKLLEYYQVGLVRFTDLLCKTAFIDIMRLRC